MRARGCEAQIGGSFKVLIAKTCDKTAVTESLRNHVTVSVRRKDVLGLQLVVGQFHEAVIILEVVSSVRSSLKQWSQGCYGN